MSVNGISNQQIYVKSPYYNANCQNANFRNNPQCDEVSFSGNENEKEKKKGMSGWTKFFIATGILEAIVLLLMPRK